MRMYVHDGLGYVIDVSVLTGIIGENYGFSMDHAPTSWDGMGGKMIALFVFILML